MTNKDIEELILKTCVKIGKKGQGALIILGGNPKYKELVKQDVKPFNIKDNPKLFESIGLMDGAVILDDSGNVKSFGVLIERNRLANIIQNYGTRHQGAMSASLSGAVSFVVSEEDRKVRVFKKGRIVMQLDSLDKEIEKNIPKAVGFLESAGFGALTTIGVGSLGLMTGVTLFSGIIIFGGFYYLINLLGEHARRKKE